MQEDEEGPSISMSSSSIQVLPDPLPLNFIPRVSTPLNLTPPDLGEIIRKDRYKEAIRAPKGAAKNRLVDEDTERERVFNKMARGGSGSVPKQPFLEVLERCGKLEMENQVSYNVNDKLTNMSMIKSLLTLPSGIASQV